ncbi:unnamed protein product, partial [marine sediment metagenome]
LSASIMGPFTVLEARILCRLAVDKMISLSASILLDSSMDAFTVLVARTPLRLLDQMTGLHAFTLLA